jgi:hypothetical protein
MALETTCPSCGAPLRRSDGTLPRTAVAILLGLVAASTGSATCSGTVIVPRGDSGTSSGGTGSAGGGAGGMGGGGGTSTIGVGGFGVLYGVGATMQGVAVSVGAGGAGGTGGAGGAGDADGG